MADFTLEDILTATGGRVATRWEGNPGPMRAWTDTRTLAPGDCFVPLSGASFDGHRFVAQALKSGAVAALVAWDKLEAYPEWREMPNLIRVEDPLLAYLALARFHRRRVGCRVAAVTGSNGKTTTKDLLHAALSPLTPTQKTQKNFNNEVGMPQTLLALEPETRLMVLEMAMRGLGQIALLSEYAEPDVAMITNIGPAHIGLLGSLEAIAAAKCEIFSGMDPAHGVGVINGDDPLLAETAPRHFAGRLELYTLADAEDIRSTPEGGMAFTYRGCPIVLPMPGRHQVSNALGVLKVGEILGYPPEALAPGLAAYESGEGRWQQLPLPGALNGWVINDAYNANPASARASLQTFLELALPGLQRVVVLGGMKELEAFSQQYHEEIGEWLATQSGIERLFLVGEEAPWMAHGARNAGFPVHTVPDTDALLRLLEELSLCWDHRVLFLKGSRAYRLEALPEALSAATPSTHR